MFPGRYFPSRFFPDRYFGKAGADPVATFGTLPPVLGSAVAGAARLHATHAAAEISQAAAAGAQRLHARPDGGAP